MSEKLLPFRKGKENISLPVRTVINRGLNPITYHGFLSRQAVAVHGEAAASAVEEVLEEEAPGVAAVPAEAVHAEVGDIQTRGGFCCSSVATNK